MPTLVLWGEGNEVLPPAEGERLCATLRPERRERIPGGHLAMLEQPDVVNRAIEEFVPVGAVT